MTGPFAPAQTIPAPGAAPVAGSIDCGAFWGALDLAQLQEAVRIDGVVTPVRLADVARNAVLDLMDELDEWRRDQVDAGNAALGDVPGRFEVDGETEYQIRWRRAVQSVVAADLAERQFSQTVRAAGADRAEALSADVGIHRRNVTVAVRDFLGRPRIIAEAI